MDFKQIQELIKLINKSNIGEVTIEEKGFRLTVKQKEEPVHQVIASPAQIHNLPAVTSIPQAPVHPSAPSSASDKPKTDTAATDNLITIKSPMIGTFYRSSSPDKAPFINVGDEIEVGKVVCIIEAMKLFNEIESEIRGRIVKVLAEDASPVEYDQPLFLVEP
jgi:acetyl-CoA carboxylase biotin carboxyl carrier protein